VVVKSGSETLLCLPVEGLGKERLAAFRALCAPIAPRLVLTSRRARSLGIDADEPVALELMSDIDANMILALVADATSDHVFVPEPAGAAAIAAIDLVKLAQVLPAVLVAETTATIANTFNPSIITVEAGAVARFREKATHSLSIAGEAHVPLSSGVRTRFVVFRDAFGEDPVAVIVGTPDLSKPVPVRIHSACLTGDGERLRGLLAEACHSACLDGDDGRVEGIHHRGGGLGDQHRRQHLRELDQFDRGDRRRARRLRHEHVIGRGIGDEREDHVGIDIGHQFERDRLVGLDAERTRPPARQNQPRRNRRAKRPEGCEPFLVEPLDRQAKQRFAAAFHHHRAAGAKFSQAPSNAYLFTGSKENGARRPAIIWH
ncbi:MAG: cyclohydrolase, partial [Alphaproteobacteria bacterium]|nr:cyclohydrolase [Alphaproteobacteria bacterium]